MTDQLTTTDRLTTNLDDLDRAAAADAGQAANLAAAAWAFYGYRVRKSANTLRNHDATLDALADFLNRREGVAPVTGDQLATTADAWVGVTWGVLEGWQAAMLTAGYSVATVNNRVSTARVYAGLASKAGGIPADALVMIKGVKGYKSGEGQEVNRQRPVSRVGRKKAAPVTLTVDQVKALKRPADATGQAARDALIMCLLLDHGLRVGEVAGLTVDAIDLDGATMTFYRPKVKKEQTHDLTANTLAAARRYLALRPTTTGSALWVGSNRRGRLLTTTMSARAIAARVGLLGGLVGVVGLSPHDCRHNWATTAADNGTSIFALRDAGGWSSIAMPSRYKAAAEIANDGVILNR